jgi:hypothetical protein
MFRVVRMGADEQGGIVVENVIAKGAIGVWADEAQGAREVWDEVIKGTSFDGLGRPVFWYFVAIFPFQRAGDVGGGGPCEEIRFRAEEIHGFLGQRDAFLRVGERFFGGGAASGQGAHPRGQQKP